MTKLFIVDDHPVFRKGLTAILNTCPDFEVVGETASGTELVRRVTDCRPDVILLDIALNGCNGIDMIAPIKERLSDARILVITVSDNEDDLSRALKAGAIGYLLKTVGISELVESIRLAAAGDAVLSPSMATKLVTEFRNSTRAKEKEGLAQLSAREKEILQLAASGASNKEIADKCFISETTVKAHFRNILGKLEAKNRAGAVGLATARGLLKVI